MEMNKATTEKTSAAPLKVEANGSKSTSGGMLYTSGCVPSGSTFIPCLHWEVNKSDMDNGNTSVGDWYWNLRDEHVYSSQGFRKLHV